ncbi:hypothetical protein [Paenibacillus sp. J2TS4]|uniref:hypothetical protein n=1 Tax=Paenibacillus sp. J2TS4 TaxID=2807194 RepID=UPI001B2DD2DF|nr:hypothetical protein [Paenibacillus sp. J2TS4]GIP32592.1 hypothetical protein J2TS4_18020 [Paenibacillus sp. J2TS4]
MTEIGQSSRILHPDEVTDILDLEIGKRIRCNYQASANQIGTLSGLGGMTKDFLPPVSSATPDGDFYFICVDKDHLGRWKLIADRNIQHSISWDALNSGGVASGSGVLIENLTQGATLRLLTGGISSADKDNEWDKYIVNSTLNNTIVAGDNDVWNWNVGVNTWTSTTISGTPANRVVRGYITGVSEHGHNPSNVTTVSTPKGFRPVLLLDANINKSLILFNGEYKKWNDTLWETISTTLPSEDIFINEGMDDLSVLDRRETTFVLDMNDSSGLGEEGKLFKAKVDLKKYIEITSLSVK